MNRHFPSPNIQRSPVGNNNRFPPFQQPYNPRFSPRSPFGSPQPIHNFYIENNPSNNDRQKINFELSSPRNPNIASPQFHSSPRAYSPRNISPRAYSPRNTSPGAYSPRNLSPYRSNNSSLNSPYSNQSNVSAGSSFNSSSYFADISGTSPSTNQKPKFQRNRFSDPDSNPGYSYNIEDYIHPSMLEDPWEKDMIEYERKMKLRESSESSKLS